MYLRKQSSADFDCGEPFMLFHSQTLFVVFFFLNILLQMQSWNALFPFFMHKSMLIGSILCVKIVACSILCTDGEQKIFLASFFGKMIYTTPLQKFSVNSKITSRAVTMKNKRKPMLKMNNAFILIFGFPPPPASYLATKKDSVKFPKSVIYLFFFWSCSSNMSKEFLKRTFTYV